MTYQEALAYIASLAPRGWRMGLDRMQAFCERAGLTDALGAVGGPQFIHIAGTNGKGSTTTYVQSLLVESGKLTGAYFSPYVVDPRERIQRQRELIAPDDLAQIVEELRPIAETFTETEFGGISEFEFKTAVAFRYWQLQRCDWVALEVGLGGRLDATNVVTSRAGIIVSIGLDHVNILGTTLAEIATEKAGIIRPKVPIVLGEMPEIALDTILAIARNANAPILRFGQDVHWDDGTLTLGNRRIEGIVPGIVGTKQGHNLALAVASVEAAGIPLSDDMIRRGANRASAPGRFERRTVDGKLVILDGAHNEDAAKTLRATLDRELPGRSIVLLTNMLQGHEMESFYAPLVDRVETVHVVPIDFPRARPVSEATSLLSPLWNSVQGHASLRAGLDEAISTMSEDAVLVVTGSFYLVGEVVPMLMRKGAPDTQPE